MRLGHQGKLFVERLGVDKVLLSFPNFFTQRCRIQLSIGRRRTGNEAAAFRAAQLTEHPLLAAERLREALRKSGSKNREADSTD